MTPIISFRGTSAREVQLLLCCFKEKWRRLFLLPPSPPSSLTLLLSREQSICCVNAAVYYYEDSKWQPGDGGISVVYVYHNPSGNTYRVVAMSASDNQVFFSLLACIQHISNDFKPIRWSSTPPFSKISNISTSQILSTPGLIQSFPMVWTLLLCKTQTPSLKPWIRLFKNFSVRSTFAFCSVFLRY